MDLPVNLLQSFLDGYFDSDGHYEASRGVQKITTVSRELAYGIEQCIAKVTHMPCSFIVYNTANKNYIEGRKVNQRDRYVVAYKIDTNTKTHGFYEDGYLWLPIRKVNKTDYFEKVYDITVKEAHSFTVNGVIVHNCRSLSKTTAGRKGYNNGLKGVSGLFYPCVNILNFIKKWNNPEVKFLVENVNSNHKDDIKEMSLQLNKKPILIDSSLFSAQSRKRYYWTNIDIDALPASNDLVLNDILDTTVDEKYFYKESYEYQGENKSVIATLNIKGHDIIKRVSNTKYKSPTITACRGGNHQKKILVGNRVRKLTPNEYRKLQTIPDWYKMLDSEKFSHTIFNKKCKKTLDKDAIMCGRIGSI